MSDPQNITINGKEIDDNKDNNMPIQNSTQIKEEPINTIKPIKIDVIKDKSDCNHNWIVCSHPTIPYTGLFCEKSLFRYENGSKTILGPTWADHGTKMAENDPQDGSPNDPKTSQNQHQNRHEFRVDFGAVLASEMESQGHAWIRQIDPWGHFCWSKLVSKPSSNRFIFEKAFVH